MIPSDHLRQALEHYYRDRIPRFHWWFVPVPCEPEAFIVEDRVVWMSGMRYKRVWGLPGK